MTRFRYFTWRIAKAFGISFHTRHATNAAAEQHLLREAEEMLGRLCWEDTEEIEELSVEYWNLRKLTKKYTDLSGKIDSAHDTLQRSHDERASLLEMVVDSTKDLVAEREVLVEKSERLAAERESILTEARNVKRRHDGIKAKLEVLVGEGGQTSAEVDRSKEELVSLKKRFKELRERRDALAARIDSLDGEIEDLDGRIETRRSEMRDEAFGSYQNIGKANRDISQTRAELGLLETEMITLYSEIGRYILTHHEHPSLQNVVRKQRSLVGQMAALRLSITLNNRLAGREVPVPQTQAEE